MVPLKNIANVDLKLTLIKRFKLKFGIAFVFPVETYLHKESFQNRNCKTIGTHYRVIYRRFSKAIQEENDPSVSSRRCT